MSHSKPNLATESHVKGVVGGRLWVWDSADVM